MSMEREFSLLELAQCAEREVKFRKKVYAQRGMTAFHQQEIRKMEQIASDYRRKADYQAARNDLFGGASGSQGQEEEASS